MRTPLTIAILLALATTSLALDDGGGRSVFATGAGNRALGLGGAFCAVSDDASAAIWNPGGLGWLERKELQATQTTLFGLGFNEQFAALVLPHHRWGTTSLTLRRFGVDGIENRDDRGVLLGDDLQDTELEVGLGFGREVSRVLSVGGTVKMQRQSLAGYSGSGYGLDLGLLARPAAGLSLGAAVRNLVEPKIRLDLDEVPDPTALRGGAAYRRGVGGPLVLLASVDLEKTSQMDARWHGGVQADLYDVLALRAGSAAGNLTAGASVRWHGLGVDYQFEDNPLGQIHRFGMALAFGPTVAESRQRAQQAEAAALQVKLDESYAARTRDQADRLAAAAHADIVAGRWEAALENVTTLQVLAPDHREILALLTAAWSGRGHDLETADDLTGAAIAYARALAANPQDGVAAASLERVRRQSAERTARTLEVRQRFDAGLDAFSRGDLLAARRTFDDLLAAYPDDPETAVMLRRTEEAIRLRAASLLDQAQWLLGIDRCDEAASLVEEARGIEPPTAAVADLARQIERCRAKTSAPAPVAAAPTIAQAPALSDARRRELAELYRRGVQALEAGRNQEAVHYWEMVWVADPEFAGVRDRLLQEYLTVGMEEFANGRLRAAVDRWEQAVRVAPDDQRARGYLERAHQQMQQMERIGASR